MKQLPPPKEKNKNKNLFLRLKRKLRLTPKKKVKDFPPKPFQKYKKEQQLTSSQHSSTSTSAFTPKITYSRKVRVPYLRTFKRYTAAVLFLVNGFLFLLTLSAPTSSSSPQAILCLFFFGNTFILLDYIWKTSKWKLVKEK